MSTPSYANPGGTGDRTSIITVTTTANLDGGTINNLVDGAKSTNNTSDACYFAVVSNADGVVIKFDFGVGAYKLITEATWYQNGSSAQGTWKWQGSSNDSTWTDLSIDFTLDAGSTGAVIGDLSAGIDGYRYYRIIKTGGTTNDTPWLREIEFKIDDNPVPSFVAAQTVAAFTQAATATAPDSAVAAQTISAFTQAATAVAPASAVAAQTITAFTQTATAEAIAHFVASQTINAFTVGVGPLANIVHAVGRGSVRLGTKGVGARPRRVM